MLKNFRKNNKGAALVTVIIAMTVVAILGVLIAYVTYSNFNMKNIDKNSKNNFYSAESVLDEISAGLQGEMAEQYAKAYEKIMVSYGRYENASDMADDFKLDFVLNMVDVLCVQEKPEEDDSPAVIRDETSYDLDHLRSYVNNTYPGNWELSAKTVSGEGAISGNALVTLQDGLLLKNIQVTYQDKGYENTITTDIKLSVPEIHFTMISEYPNISDYAFIANNGMEVSGNKSLSLEGSAFAGHVPADGESDSLVYDSIVVGNGSTFNASDASMIVNSGNILVEHGGTFESGSNTTVWSRGVEAVMPNNPLEGSEGNQVGLNGATYLADDITLTGKGNRLTLAGQLFGYGFGDKASANSAIIINGKNSELDMSGLNTLVLAGTAYLASSKEVGPQTNSADVMTGDSIAVKSNQLAYLVPSDAEGVISNPMSVAQYNELITDTEWKKKIVNTPIVSINRTLNAYGSVDIMPVFSQKQGGTVYLYIVFEHVSDAAQYFNDVFTDNSVMGEKLQEYIHNYITLFTGNTEDYTRLVTSGNYLIPAVLDEESGEWKPAEANAETGVLEGQSGIYTAGASTVAGSAQELSNYADNFECLCHKLITSCTVTERSNLLFDNLIQKDGSDHYFLKNITGATVSNANQSVMVNGSMMTTNVTINDGVAVIKAGDTAAIIADGTYYMGMDGPNKGVILATGDVHVNHDFTGTILAKGKVYIDVAGVRLVNSSEAVSAALRLGFKADDGTSYEVLKCFSGGDNYSFMTDDTANEYVDHADVRNLVSYENWKSE